MSKMSIIRTMVMLECPLFVFFIDVFEFSWYTECVR